MPIEATRDVFQAIADPTRRQIIDLLSKGEMTPNAIAERFHISRPAISQHLKHLIECDIIEVTQKGRERYCKIKPQNLIPAFLWLEKYQRQWTARIDNFEKHLNKLKSKK
jgi:DNA-binding transcriptional ArsR family regulator